MTNPAAASMPLPQALQEEPAPAVVELVFPVQGDRCYVPVDNELDLDGLIIPAGTRGVQIVIDHTKKARFFEGRWEFLVEFLKPNHPSCWVALASVNPNIWVVSQPPVNES